MTIHSTLNQIRRVLLVSGLSVAAGASAEVSMCVHPIIGNPVYISLKDKPDIAFSNGSISIKGQTFEIKDISKYTFVGTDGIDNIGMDAGIRIEDRTVYLPTRLSSSGVRIVDINGKEYPATLKKEGDSTSIDLSALESGLYILSLDGSSLKILLK